MQKHMSKFDLDKNYSFTNDMKKVDYLKVALSSSSSSNMNKGGSLIFQNNQSANCLDICNAVLYYKITVTIKSTDAAKKDITLEHNFFPRMFDRMYLKLGTNMIEDIQDPGEVSTMLNFVMTDADYKKEYGWKDG